MTQGLRNAAATMQRFMDDLLHGLQPLTLLSHIDDLLIFSKNIHENIRNLEIVLQLLQSANIQANLPKCQFALSEILHLGLLISHNKIQPNKVFIAKISFQSRFFSKAIFNGIVMSVAMHRTIMLNIMT
jgi:hypothetical protein